MKITVTNFRGVSSASIDTKKITLVAGRNHSGKTSIIQGVAAARTGRTIPIDDILKTQAGMLVHAGTACGEVIVSDENGESKVTYPDATRSSVGTIKDISTTSAGLSSLVDIPRKQGLRAKAISDLLKTEPSDADIVDAIQKTGTPKESINRIVQTIHIQGWDAAHNLSKEANTKLKGRWEEVTGGRFGTEKVKTFLPATWEPDLVSAKKEDLEAVLQQEREWLNAARVDTAITAEKIAKLEHDISGLIPLRSQCETLKVELTNLFTAQADAKKFGRSLPPAEQPIAVPCPYCSEPVSIAGVKVVKAAILPTEEIARRKRNIDDAAESLLRINKQIDEKNSALLKANTELAIATKAADELNSAANHPGAVPASRIDECQAKVARAEARLSAFLAKQKSDQLAESIAQNQQVIDLLHPDGLRLSKLKSGLDPFNAELANVCSLAEFKCVGIKPDMSISYNGTPYMLLSVSEQYRVRIVLQVAIAARLKDDLVLIDGADVLDTFGRNGLFKMLEWQPMSSIVAMTIYHKDKVPDMSKVHGNSYWIENGTATENTR